MVLLLACCLLSSCRGAHKDRLEIKRMGSSNVEASITLEQDFMPQAYALDPRLAEVSVNCKERRAVVDAGSWLCVPAHVLRRKN
jgi:hypothetical protein